MIRYISRRIITTGLQSQAGLVNTTPRSVSSMVGLNDLHIHHQNRVILSNENSTIRESTILQPRYSGSYKSMRANNSSESGTKADRVHDLITKSQKKVFVFMKGVPEEPACGYSNAVVQILNAYGVEFDSFDVLSDDQIRQEVKSYSNWPTIPQVYVDGSFVGGCDILIQMHQNNELDALFEDKITPEGTESSNNKKK